MNIIAKNIFLKFVIIAIAIVSLSSCNSPYFYSETVEIKEQKWDKNALIQFNVDIEKTENLYDFILEVSNTEKYSYSNLWLFIQITSPKNAVLRDTFECILADADGKWYGKKNDDVFSLPLFYKQTVAFQDIGRYKVEIQHGMRHDVLESISSIGLYIKQKDK